MTPRSGLMRTGRGPALVAAVTLLFLLSLGGAGVASEHSSPGAGGSLAVLSGGSPGVPTSGFHMSGYARPQTGTANTLIDTINVPGGPTSESATFDPANGYVYFGSNGTNLTAVNGATDKIAAQIYLGPYASPATPNYVGGGVNDLYAPVISTDPPPDNVSVISGATNLILKYLSTGGNSYPTTGVYDAANGYLYIPAMGATLKSHVTVIDTATNTVVATIPVGAFPSTPAYDPADGDIYVPNTYSSNNLTIISGTTDTSVGSIPITFPASGVIAQEDHLTESPVYDPVTQAVYQPDTGNVTLTEIKGTTFVRNYTVGAGPQTPAVDPLNGNLWVPIAFLSQSLFGSANDTVSIVNVTTNTVTNVTVGESPETPVYDPANNEMYVACQVPSSSYGVVTAVNATTGQVIATINVGTTPVVPALDTTHDELFVPNFVSNNVSVIGAGPVGHSSGPGTYTVTFTESGLPANAWWNVRLDGILQNQTTPSISFPGVLNGSHSWTVGPWANMSSCNFTGASTTSGSVSVSGGPQNVAMPFSCSGSVSSGGGGSTPLFGLADGEGYYVLGGIAAAAVVAVAGGLLFVRAHRVPRMGGAVPPPPPPSAPPPPPPPPPP